MKTDKKQILLNSNDNNEAIKFNRLSFGYIKAESVCFSSADFSLAENEKTILVGDNGSGKTTLLYILSGLITDYIGKLDLLGMCGEEIKKAYKNLVFITESPVLLENKNLVDNIEFAYRVLYGDSSTMDYIPCIKERLKSIDPKIKVKKLSYHERVMIECERARLKDIKLLLMDRTMNDVKNCMLAKNKKADFTSVQKKTQIDLVKRELCSLVDKSKSAIVVCDNYDDVSMLNAKDFSVLEIHLGKIYKHKSLNEFKKSMKHVSGVKIFEDMQKKLVRVSEFDGNLTLSVYGDKSKLELENEIMELIKKRKKQQKQMKNSHKSGDNTENVDIHDDLCIELINIPFSSKIAKSIYDNDALVEEYFVLGFNKNYSINDAIKSENVLMFIESTGERIL